MNKEIQLPDTEDAPCFMQNVFDVVSAKAYIKQEMLNDEPVWSIYNYQGEKMGYAASREIAFAVANQNEFVGFSVH